MILFKQMHGMPVQLCMAAESAIVNTKKDDPRRARVGCVIVRNDGAVVCSKNRTFSNGRMPKAHAEARCVKKADKNSVAYVARVRRDGSIGCAKPCKTCMIMLRSRGVKEVYYTISACEWGKIDMRKSDSEKVWNNNE